MNLLWIFVLFLISSSLEIAGDHVLVVQLINVGARYPKMKLEDWVTYPNRLTPVGMRQLYLLGREMSKRYVYKANFLSERNLPLEVVVRAAFANDYLTIASASAYTRGLYAVGTGQKLTNRTAATAVPPYRGANYAEYQKKLKYAALPNYHETVPIMVEGGKSDYVLSAKTYCPRLKKIVSDSKGKGSLKSQRNSLMEKGKGAFEKLREIFKKEIKNLENATELWDYIVAADYYSLPKSISQDHRNILESIYKFVTYEEYFYDNRVARVISNGVLTEFKDVINDDKSSPKKKLLSYIVEDQSIYAMLKLINETKAKSITKIPFASIIEFKVTKKSDGTKVVSAYFDDTKLNWNNGESELTIKEFNTWLNKTIYTNSEFEQLCTGANKELVDEDRPWIIAGLCVGPILFIVVIATVIYAMKKDKPENTSEAEEVLTADE